MKIQKPVSRKQFDDLLDLIEYGMNYQRGEENDESYIHGVISATGYIVSCWIVQKTFRGNCDGVGCQDVVEALGLEELPTRDKVEPLLRKLLKTEMGCVLNF